MRLPDNPTEYPFRISELIVARLSGTITPEQDRELDAWIAESPQNEALYSRAADGKRFINYLHHSEAYDYTAKFSKLETRMKRDGRRRFARRVSVAAAVLIPIIAAFFVVTSRLATQRDGIAAQTDQIVPGRARAQLTLADGSTIELNPGMAKEVLPGTNIVFDGDTLMYMAAEPDAVPQPQRISIPRGGEYFLRLSDGTGVWLNAETQLTYQTVFGTGERRVFLRGEAYFKVTADPARPFIVESENHTVTVLGTSFAIRAYGDEPLILTTLESGRVKVAAGDDTADLRPGMQSVARDGRIDVREVDTSVYTAWYTGKFVFVDQPLDEILATLARWYDINILYTEPGIENIRFTGELKRYSGIDELLAKFETLEKVRFDITDRMVTVSPY